MSTNITVWHGTSISVLSSIERSKKILGWWSDDFSLACDYAYERSRYSYLGHLREEPMIVEGTFPLSKVKRYARIALVPRGIGYIKLSEGVFRFLRYVPNDCFSCREDKFCWIEINENLEISEECKQCKSIDCERWIEREGPQFNTFNKRRKPKCLGRY